MIVCGVLLPTPTGPASPGLPLALIAWSITEVIRYLYYALNLLGAVPYLLVWCRYTFFTVLYPVGVTGELLCLYAAQSYVAKSKLWSLEMPNNLNVTFSYHYVLLFTMLLYIPLFPQMYLHMFTQRQKVMAVSTGKKVKWFLSWKSSATSGILPQISQGELRHIHSCITLQCCVKNLFITFQRICICKFIHRRAIPIVQESQGSVLVLGDGALNFVWTYFTESCVDCVSYSWWVAW